MWEAEITGDRVGAGGGGQGRFPGEGSMRNGADIGDRVFCFSLILNLPLSFKDGSTFYKKVNKHK